MRRPFFVFLFSLLGLCAVPRVACAELPAALKTAFMAARLPQASYALLLERVDGTQRLLGENTSQPMNPASVMKLLTTYAALELLGPTFTWRTEARADRVPVNGILEGNLYLKGGGDPKLTMEQFGLLLRHLRLRGIREIHGDVVVDRSIFALPLHDAGAFDGEGLRPYNVGADALLVNFNAHRFTLVPDAELKRVGILLETPDAQIKILNRLIAVPGDCGDWREAMKIAVSGDKIEMAGRFPIACGERQLALSLLPADAQLEGLFRALWAELGGSWTGRLQSGATPADSLLVAAHESPPLGEIVRDVNKFSNNVMARQVFLGLSADYPATYEKSTQRLRDWLARKKIAAPELRVDNGAGLSRQDRISAESLAALLRAAWASPVMPELVASLPIYGEDGTLKKRGNAPLRGRAHLKTGSIEGARSLAGYLHDSRGERWVFIVLINHPNAARAKQALDTLVEWAVSAINEPKPGEAIARSGPGYKRAEPLFDDAPTQPIVRGKYLE
jgi:serine-type D-Ala-D-Ala carboxypeptidase/endopeptidase (penicillin-binding protein 4)